MKNFYIKKNYRFSSRAKFFTASLALVVFLLFSPNATAQCFIDLGLNSWSVEGNSTNGNWVPAPDGSSVLQTINSNPSFYVSNNEYFNTTIQGEFRVQTTNDDDFIGFVIGYQSPNSTTPNDQYDFILFDWKQAAQASGGCTAPGAMRLSRIQGTSSNLTTTFWCQTDPIVTNLGTYTGLGGWADNTLYTFQVKYGATNITVTVNGTEVFNVDGTYSSGRFGFYNYSQEQVLYQNFSLPFGVVINKTDASCAGNNDGIATAEASDFATPPYDYAWSNGGDTQTITGLAPGTYSVTVTSQEGCTATESVTIGVQADTENPVVSANTSVNAFLNASGIATISVADIEISSTDNCGIASKTLSQSSFTCANIGNNNITFTVTDLSGNSTVVPVTVNVVDNIAPTASCQNITVPLDASGTAIVFSTDIDNGSTDNCGISGTSSSPAIFNCSNIGPNNVTFTVTDTSGNTSSCVAVVTITDPLSTCNQAPVAVCQPVSIDANGACQGVAVAADFDGGSTDVNNDPLIFTVSPMGPYPLGVTNVTLTVSDGTLSDSCTTTITVTDNTAPTAICQNITAQLDNTGSVTITPTDVDGGSTDACGIASLQFSEVYTAFGEVNENGNLTITLPPGQVVTSVDFASYGTPNGSNGSYTIGACHAANSQSIVESYALGNNSFSIPATNTVFGDPCSGTVKRLYVAVSATSQTSNITYTCADVGAQNVTLFVTDNNGNTSSCTATVTVEDNVAPTAVCQNITVQLDTNGNATIIPADVDGGSSDACGIASTTIDVSTFDCSNVGTNNVILTVTDNNGNVSTCTATVTVEDNVAPTAVCQNITVQLDANGYASITPADVDGGSTDVCGIANTSLDVSAFDCSNIGNNNVTLIVTDTNGNSSTCTAVVTVEDTTPPTLTCPGDITQNSDLGVCGAVVTYAAPTVSDNCSALGTTTFSYTGAVQQFTVPAGVTEIHAIVSGAQGGANWVNNVNFGGTVEADIPVVPGQILYIYVGEQPTGLVGGWNGGGNGESAGKGGGGSSDIRIGGNALTDRIIVGGAGGGAGFWSGQHVVGGLGGGLVGGAGYRDTPSNPGGDPGTQTSSGNGTCVSLNNPAVAGGLGYGGTPNGCGCEGYGGGAGYYGGAGSGNCRGGGGGSSYTDPSLTNVVHSQGVHVGNGEIIITYDTALAVNQTAGLPSGSTFPVGTTTNTFEVTDASGNTATCSFDITINDNEAPTAVCQNITIQLDANGNASITPADVDGGSSDACGIASTTIDVSTFDCSNVGANNVVLTVTDNNGNVSTCTAVVTVEDNVAPTAVCQNITVQLDANGNASITPADVDGGSSDACGIASTTIDVSTFDCSNVGTNNVILTVTDNNGNVSTCTAVVTVEDNVAPTAVCQNITVQLDSNGNVSITPADVDGGSSDACGIASTTIDVSAFDCSNVGANNVVLTVTDNNGNVSTCTAVVTVEDNIAPTAVCQNITVQLDANGNASITPADVDGGSSDACGIASTTIDVSTFDCSNVGANNVVLTVTDNNGNVSTCTAVVTVEDNVSPTAVCQNITVQLDANGNASITPADVDGGSSDACGIASTTIDVSTFDCSNVGTNNVILTVTDNNGNVSTCTAVVTVEDNIAPLIVCPADVNSETRLGDCFSLVYFPQPYTQDNCGIDTVVQTAGLPSGSQFPVGVSTVAFTATDVNGNVSTCSFTITVTDNEAPMAVCQNITIQLDANGNATITPADIDGGSSDNCGLASTSIDVDTFDCSNVGDNNVILTVTDVNGNVSTCTAIVTVEDVTAPVVACQNIIVELDPLSGTVTIAGTDIDNGSTDACGIASYELDIDTFDCSNIGDNTVVLTVTDNNGNVSTCTAIVTVEDNTAPVLVCQDFTIEIGADGTATLDPSNVIASNDDACGIFTVAVDITQFSCADIGNPVTVQIFSQDNNGNLATCTATVTAVDLLAPVVTCPADQTVDPGVGNLFYIVPDYFATGEATAMDNCTDPVVLTSQDPVAGTPLSDGIYTVTLTATDEYGNVGTCDFELTVESVLGIGGSDQNIGSVAMYPNPAKNILNISNPQGLDLERLEIYDLRGRLVQATDLRGMGSSKIIDVNQLAAASYYVKIMGENGQTIKRLLKE